MSEFTHVKVKNESKTVILTKQNFREIKKELPKVAAKLTVIHECFENGSTNGAEEQTGQKTSHDTEMAKVLLKLRAVKAGLSEDASEEEIIAKEIELNKKGNGKKGSKSVSSGNDTSGESKD